MSHSGDIKNFRISFKTFITSQFNYCPLVWIWHNRGLNYKNSVSRQKIKFTGFAAEGQICVYPHENLQYVATEIYKVKNGLSPEIMKQVFLFQENENYNLRSGTHLVNRNMHIAHFETDTIINLGPKLWKHVPDEIRNASPLSFFKSRIKIWTRDKRLSRLSKIFVKDLGLLKSVQISSGIHYSHVQYISPKIRC